MDVHNNKGAGRSDVLLHDIAGRDRRKCELSPELEVPMGVSIANILQEMDQTSCRECPYFAATTAEG